MVGLIVAAHPDHGRTIKIIKRLQASHDSLLLCTHSLVELYAVLSRMPASPRIGPDLAKRLVLENIKQMSIKTISLDADDYMSVLDNMTSLGYVGGIIYDMLIVQAARKAKAERILTLNESDFLRLCQDNSPHVLSP